LMVERGGEFLAVVDQLADEAEEAAGAGGGIRPGRGEARGRWGGGGGLGGHEPIGNTESRAVSRKIFQPDGDWDARRRGGH
jgi:hypothetical protein